MRDHTVQVREGLVDAAQGEADLPIEDGDLFRKWIYQSLEASITDEMHGAEALDEMTVYFEQKVADRRRAPRDDLISHLLDERIEGRALTQEELLGFLRLVLIAGIDTTWSAIGAALWHFAGNPNDRIRLVEDRSQIPSVVEEVLRYFSPVTMAREIVKDCPVGQTTLKAGQMVLLSFPAANRDPTYFADADRFVLDRTDHRRHVAFGFGRHRCIGAGLARMEIRIALEEWVSAIPKFSLSAPDEVIWSKGIVRGPRRLPLQLG